MQHTPLYKYPRIDRNFIDRFKVQDPSGHDVFIGENDCTDLNGENHLLDSENDEIFLNTDSKNNEVVQTSEHPPVSDKDANEICRENRAYSEYAQTDPIRRFQFDYDKYVALASVFPVAKVNGNTLTKRIHHMLPTIIILRM